jgi:ankyrin repeat protein
MDRLSQVVASRNESDSSELMKFSDLDANRVKEMMEAARDGPLNKFRHLWRRVDLNFHVKDESRSFTRWAEHGLTPQQPDARREETLRMDGEYVVCPGRTALHMAAANGQVDIVDAICRTPKVDFHAKDVFGYTALHLACYSRSENKGQVIKKLLEKMDPNVAANEKGFHFTALHLAVKSKSTEIVNMLLDWNPKGVNVAKVLDVGAKSGSGLTALHLAVTEAIAIKKGLELNKAKLKLKDENLGEVRKNFESMIADRDNFELMIAAMIRFINNNSPEAINKSDRTKSTPLHTSVKASDYRLVEILLDDGDKIDPELLDNKRRTASEIALHQRDYAMVHILRSYLECAGIVGNHQAYADSATAILVGAALLVTVTFAAWVQIPTNDSTVFWVFISLSFYFAVATFISAASAAIPSKGNTLGIIRRAVLLSAFCLAISLACAVAAFAIAGFLIVPPSIEHQRKVIATTVIGGFVCLFCLLSFIRKIFTALGLFFLMLDLVAQQQLVKCISTVVTTILGTFLEDQYNALYTTPINNFFKIGEEDDQTSSHGGSVSNSNPGNENSGDETRDS